MNRKRPTSKKPNSKSRIPFRLNILFFIVAILFAALIGQLVYLQIIYGSKFKAEVNSSDNTVETTNVQRGMIYDSTGRVLVGNKAHQAITYTKGSNVLSSDLYKIANKLGTYVSVSTEKLTPRQEADYYLTDESRLKAVEKKAGATSSNMSVSDRYDKAEKYLMDSKAGIPLTHAQKNAAAIFAKMSGSYALSTTNIKDSDVTQKEVAEVGENLSEMPGVKVGTSYTRDYPYGKSIKSIIGTVSSEKTGLPSDKVNTLLASGYSRDDSVGQSYLEEQYQSVLAGTKKQTLVTTEANSSLQKEVTQYGGKKGDNLELSINAKFQNKLQSLVRSAAESAGGVNTGVYAVVMNPYTGAVIGIAGVDQNPSTGKITDNALGTINNSIVMGSVVKGAMVSGALMENVISPTNSTLTDKPIDIGGTKKASWFNKTGSANMAVTASEALEVSSNSYMMQLAMKEAKFNYTPGGALTMNPNVFDTERKYFNMFGLGVQTGIDIPGESTGIEGASGAANIGHALDESFGNYDAYTVMQVAQYMSTVVNGGYRIAPHVLSSIRSTQSNGQLGSTVSTVSPRVLNTIPWTSAERKVVTDGFYDVVHGTNTYKTGGSMSSISPSVSGKTGTAETFYKGNSTTTLSLASYAPSTKPQVVVALAMPNMSDEDDSNNMALAKQIYSAYWDMVQSSSNLKSQASSYDD
nr:penicillin-binding protein 2 [Levilactobacillus bambusae]